MNLERVEKELRNLVENTENQSQNTLSMKDISRLTNIKRLLKKIPLLDKLERKTNIDYKLKLQHKKQKLNEFRNLIEITDEIDQEIKSFKDEFLDLQKVIINQVSNFPYSKIDFLLDKIFKFLVPIDHAFFITRNVGFNIWNFDNRKQDRFDVKNFFLTLESGHDYTNNDCGFKILEDYELEVVKANIKVDLESNTLISISFLIPHSQRIIETNVFLLLQCPNEKTHIIEEFFKNPLFQDFRINLLTQLIIIAQLQRQKEIERDFFKSELNSIQAQLCYVSLRLFLFHIKHKKNLKFTYFAEQHIQSIKDSLRVIYLKDLDHSIVYNLKENNQKNEQNLRDWINHAFKQFIYFFEQKLLKLRSQAIKPEQILLYLKKNLQVSNIEHKDNKGIDYFELKNFERNKNLDFFIKDKKLLDEILMSFSL